LKQESKQPSARQDLEKVEKIKHIAYSLWLARRDRHISGDANCDYYQAERIFESYKNLKLLLLGSFGFSTVAFVLGRSPEEHYVNAMNAVIELHEIGDEHDLTSELCQKFLQSDMLQLMADCCSRAAPPSVLLPPFQG
jgi:hypothetical protein